MQIDKDFIWFVLISLGLYKVFYSKIEWSVITIIINKRIKFLLW